MPDVRIDPKAMGRQLKEAREARGWTQTRIAKALGVKQQTIQKMEAGTTRQSKYLFQAATVLGVDIPGLESTIRQANQPSIIAQEHLYTGPDLPVYAVTEAGSGALIVSTDPVDYVARPQPLARVKDGYGILVAEESMVPEFWPGDTALVHPHLPPVAGNTCVFYNSPLDGDHSRRSTIKHYRGQSATEWRVTAWNGPDGRPHNFSLKKAEWQICHVVVGRYTRK